MKGLMGLAAHQVFCEPPGTMEVILAHREGTLSPACQLWIGRSIELMGRGTISRSAR
jgi:hypothetical protein